MAFILGVAASVGFLLLGLPETLDFVSRFLGGYVAQLLASLSLVDHFESLTRGVIEVRSLMFFLLFICGWLGGGMLVLRETKAN